jgi:periplasmic mercuric ion binding protein
MKLSKTVLPVVLALFIGLNLFAQAENPKTETFKVWGNCGMCKTRIEKAAKADGVSKAEWDEKTDILTLTYDPAKVKPADIQKKIAAVGHDTELYKADDKAYNSLPGCCKYDRKP